MRKFFRYVLIVFQAAVLAVLAGVGAFFWRLHRGPVNIDAYVPYLMQAAAPSDMIADMRVGSAEMRWGGFKHPIEFVVTDFKAFGADKQLVLSVPKVATSFSLAALAEGSLAPRSLAIYKPYLHLKLTSGDVPETVESESDFSPDTLIHLLRRETHLSEFSLIGAVVKITDERHGAVWDLPSVNLNYSHRFMKNRLRGNLTLKMQNGEPLDIRLNGKWKRRGKDNKIDLSVAVDDLDLTRSRAAQKYAYLQNFTTPVAIRLNTRLDLAPFARGLPKNWRPTFSSIGFSVKGGKGIVNLPAPVSARYDLDRFSITGALYDSVDRFDITSFDLLLQNGGEARGSFLVSGIGAAVDTGDWAKISADLNAEATGIPMDMLPDYWPASIGADVHGWVKRNMTGGMINDAKFSLHFKGLENAAGVDADKVDGVVNVTKTNVAYLDGMPPVNDVSGSLLFSRDAIVITVAEGRTFSVNAAAGGTFSFLDLTKPVARAAMDMNLAGDARDVLKIIDSPALELMKSVGISPEQTTGTASGNLKLDFPLGDAFKSVDQLKIKASADVRNADVDGIALGLGLQDAILRVDLNDRDLTLRGTALFYSATAKYTLTQSFDKTKETATDIFLHVDLNDRARDRLNYPLFTMPAVGGMMPTDLRLVLKNDATGVLEIESDLTNAAVDLREIGWSKPPKTAGKAFMRLNMENCAPKSIPVIELTDANGTEIKGSLSFKNGGVDAIDFAPVRAGRTNAALRVAFAPDSIDFDLTGSDFDVSGLMSRGTSLSTKSSRKESDADRTLNFRANIGKMWLSRDGYAENNTFSAAYQNGWKNMNAQGFVGDQKVPLNLTLVPTEKPDEYAVSMTSKDAGYTLKALDYISTVKGGELKLNSVYTRGVGSTGTLDVSDFYLEEQQTLVKILSLTSLTGIIDTLRGERLFFARADIPFSTDNESVTVSDGVVSGSSLGITLNGKYYRNTGYMNFRGSIIPFYSINSFLGKIPLIGKIFSGEKGGGLIAPTYTVKGKLPSPDVSVNAFSALAPGAVRSLFGIGHDDSDASLNDEPEKPRFAAPSVPAVKSAEPAVVKELNDDLCREPAPVSAGRSEKSPKA